MFIIVYTCASSRAEKFVEIKTDVWRTTNCYLWDETSGQFKPVMSCKRR